MRHKHLLRSGGCHYDDEIINDHVFVRCARPEIAQAADRTHGEPAGFRMVKAITRRYARGSGTPAIEAGLRLTRHPVVRQRRHNKA